MPQAAENVIGPTFPGAARTMACVIRFTTRLFDVSKERRNPINPIFGVSLLEWLRARAGAELRMSEPDAEDRGWYSGVEWQGRVYLVGASAADEGPEREWILQIDKQRSLGERLLGRSPMHPDDGCVRYIEALLASEPAFGSLSVEPDE
jgi:hypothetical protein